MQLRRTAAIFLLLSLTITTIVFAQTTASESTVLERNIRAELGFLASDAMQGRGSGTGFERLAAEYIGSQFRQFGLEPAGDSDSTGQKGFVQRIALTGAKFSEPPTLTVTSGTDVKKWTFGRDLLVSFLRSPQLTGNLQIANIDSALTKGSVALVKLPEGTDAQKRQDLIRRARTEQAGALLLLETDANKRTREAGNVRLPSLPTSIGVTNGGAPQFAVISLGKEAYDAIVAIPAGAKVDFSGPIQSTPDSATWNAIGMLKGSDPNAASEVILLSAHLDHLGTTESTAPGADTINNGADDDASGCVAVMELARVLAAGKRPKRTIYFVCFGSEERGGFGSHHFVENPPVPLEQLVADVHFEMLGRPDAKVPANTLWLTGFERSTLGPELAKQGALIVGDPHPDQNFFQRSDNYRFALRGVIAHTISSFGLHTDYHRPSDDISKVDFPFMTRSINSLIKPIRWLADSNFKPAWL